VPPDDRTYWTRQMDAAHAFMQRLLDYPVAECGEPLRCLREMLRERLAEEGFLPYPYEFRHFSRGDADCELLAGSGRPARFGPVHWSGDDMPAAARDPLEPFIALQGIARRMRAREPGSGPLS